jgi:hypothetical protein
VINPKLQFGDICSSLLDNKIVVVDDFLEETVADYLRQRMISEKYFQDNYPCYKANNYHYKSDAATKLIADDVIKNIPVLKSFQRAWSFIYDNKCAGVNFHADPSATNINIWVSKNESVNNFDENGLVICAVKPPPSWGRSQWSGNQDNCIYNFLEENRPSTVRVEYKFNRAIFFDGAYFHKTDNVNMKDGYENRRVSYTMLFGTSLNPNNL